VRSASILLLSDDKGARADCILIHARLFAVRDLSRNQAGESKNSGRVKELRESQRTPGEVESGGIDRDRPEK
jgi:hypothetical protein